MGAEIWGHVTVTKKVIKSRINPKQKVDWGYASSFKNISSAKSIVKFVIYNCRKLSTNN